MTAFRPDLDLYALAYLAGGAQRVVDTASWPSSSPGCGCMHRGAGCRPDRRHPVEAAVLDAIGARGHRSVDTIRWRLTDDERITASALPGGRGPAARRDPGRGGCRPAPDGRASADWRRSRPSTAPSTGVAHSRPSGAGGDAGRRPARGDLRAPALPGVRGDAHRAEGRDGRPRGGGPPGPATASAARGRSGSTVAGDGGETARPSTRRKGPHVRGHPASSPDRAALTSSASPAGPCARRRGRRRTQRREPLHDQLAVRLRDHLVGVPGQHERRDPAERLQRPGLVEAGERRVELRDHVDRRAGDHRVQVAGERRVDVGRGERQRPGDRRDQIARGRRRVRSARAGRHRMVQAATGKNAARTRVSSSGSPKVRLGQVAARGGEERRPDHLRPEQLRAQGREPHDRHAAHRVPDQDHRPRRHPRLEHGGQVLRQLLDRRPLGRPRPEEPWPRWS